MNSIKKYIKENFSNFTYFYSILRVRIIIVFALSILVGLLDSVGLTMFIPLLQLAEGNGSKIDLGNLTFITDITGFLGVELTVNKILLFLILLFLLKGFILYKVNIYKIIAQQFLTKKVRMSIVNKFPLFKYNQFVKTNIGKIQNIFIGEISRLHSTYSSYIAMVQGFIMIVIYMLFSFIVNWQFAILVCIGGVISNLIFNKLSKTTKVISSNISIVNNNFANMLYQYIGNFKYLKATGKISEYRLKIESSIDNVQEENFKLGVLNSKIISFREPVLICIVVFVIFIQLNFFSSTIETILISLLLFYRALSVIISVQSSYNTTIANQGAIDNILSFLEEIDQNKEEVGKYVFKGFNENIYINNISFNYDEAKILDKINFKIEKNQSIALVGESGSGKTTLVNILIKLFNPSLGEILIDGVNIKQYNQFSYQNKIGYISQETTIFNDSIFNNVTFWDKKTPINIQRFNEALNKASIFDFVENLPDKANTLLGNNGVNLSGGQRQRISIARELYKKIEILILDEATSALDSETEKEIQNSIEKLKGKVTIISIAHRLSTIKNADIIYLMDKGKIISSGTFNELINKSDRFKIMVNLQEV